MKIIAVLILLVFNFANSEEKKIEDTFMCRRLMGTELTKLKSSMLDDCNLSKPFSLTTSNIPLESGYTYCCHKK